MANGQRFDIPPCDMQIYARERSQAVDGRLIAMLRTLHGGNGDAEAYARAAVGARCREVHAVPALIMMHRHGGVAPSC